ncbi:MAG TPA: hypothetical protein VHB79_19545 [Polyangiaceae bacterium]|nr:hypothetical protein [Polyangiaceae bacterium]
MIRTGIAFGCFATLASLAIAPACTSTMDDCANTSTCPPEGGSAGSSNGGSSGTAGSKTGGSSGSTNAGEGGNATGGSSSAGNGGSISIGGEAGASGGGGGATLPCDGACTAPTFVCDEPNNTCVECLEEGDCAVGAKKKCDTTAKACVECLASADCADAKAAKCDGGACVKCNSNDDCAHIAGKTVCDTAAGECVECTGKDYTFCGMSMGTPLVCDTVKRTCTTSKEHSIGPCKPCVSDAQCKAGQLCAMEVFGDAKTDVGHFCFWKQGDIANGAPATCASNGRPYASAIANQVSIDGVTATICGLRVSTCTSVNQFSSKDCSTSSAADDSKCGFDAPNDAKCVVDGGGFSCTMTCASDDDRDCPLGIQCDTDASPPVCKL